MLDLEAIFPFSPALSCCSPMYNNHLCIIMINAIGAFKASIKGVFPFNWPSPHHYQKDKQPLAYQVCWLEPILVGQFSFRYWRLGWLHSHYKDLSSQILTWSCRASLSISNLLPAKTNSIDWCYEWWMLGWSYFELVSWRPTCSSQLDSAGSSSRLANHQQKPIQPPNHPLSLFCRHCQRVVQNIN